MKHKKSTLALLVALVLAAAQLMSGCSLMKKQADPVDEWARSAEEYEQEIKELRAQISILETQMEQMTAAATAAMAKSQKASADAAEPAAEEPQEEIKSTPAEENNNEDKAENNAQQMDGEGAAEASVASAKPEKPKKTPQIVVFGDSIWDSTRDTTGVGYLVGQYTEANVYNCAIGGTSATIPDGDETECYDNWTSTSLVGLVNAAIGKVDSDTFMLDYAANAELRRCDMSKTDMFIIAYGLNDYFKAARLNSDDNTDLHNVHTYGGALRWAIMTLHDNFPKARIMLIGPTYCQFFKDGVMYTDSNMKDFGNGPLSKYAAVAQNVGENSEVLFIDGYSKLGINIYNADEYLEDGVHLTAAGRELYAKAVSSCFKYGQIGQVSGNSTYY